MTNQETLKQEEEYFDNLNYARRNTSVIYPEIDCRSNDIYLPSDPSIPPCDPRLYLKSLISYKEGL